MKLPPSPWHYDATLQPQADLHSIPPNHPAPFWLRTLYPAALPICQAMESRSINDLEKRSTDENHLAKRKDKTITLTETSFVTSSLYFNTTITIHTTTQVFTTSTITVTKNQTVTQQIITYQPTTLTQDHTTTAPVTISTSPTPSSNPNSKHTPASATEAAESSATGTITPIAQHHSGLSPLAVAGIVFGVLGILALLAAGFWAVRRFYKMYRKERVLRKQLQTEGNEMPAMKTGEGGGRDGGGLGDGDREVRKSLW